MGGSTSWVVYVATEHTSLCLSFPIPKMSIIVLTFKKFSEKQVIFRCTALGSEPGK